MADGIFVGKKFRCEDTHDGKHRKAASVDLRAAYHTVVRSEAEGSPKLPVCLFYVLGPDGKLQRIGQQEQGREARSTRHRCDGTDSSGHLIESRGLS